MILRQPVEWCNLQNIDQSIKERTMSVEKQPPNNLRPRYKSDGQRQIEKARTRPMMIQVCLLFIFPQFIDFSSCRI